MKQYEVVETHKTNVSIEFLMCLKNFIYFLLTERHNGTTHCSLDHMQLVIIDGEAKVPVTVLISWLVLSYTSYNKPTDTRKMSNGVFPSIPPPPHSTIFFFAFCCFNPEAHTYQFVLSQSMFVLLNTGEPS